MVLLFHAKERLVSQSCGVRAAGCWQRGSAESSRRLRDSPGVSRSCGRGDPRPAGARVPHACPGPDRAMVPAPACPRQPPHAAPTAVPLWTKGRCWEGLLSCWVLPAPGRAAVTSTVTSCSGTDTLGPFSVVIATTSSACHLFLSFFHHFYDFSKAR